jgi:hypothetical protein
MVIDILGKKYIGPVFVYSPSSLAASLGFRLIFLLRLSDGDFLLTGSLELERRAIELGARYEGLLEVPHDHSKDAFAVRQKNLSQFLASKDVPSTVKAELLAEIL